MSRGRLLLAAVAAAVSLLAACTVTATTSDTTEPEAPAPSTDAGSAEDADLAAEWIPAPFAGSTAEAAMALTPSPAPGLCVDVFDLNLGDTSEPVEVRATFGAPGVEGPLVGVVTLQEWESPESAAVNFDALARRNNLADDFPAVPGAKARITAENPFPESEGTPVAFVRGSWTVLVSLVPDHESALPGWAQQVDAFLLDGTTETPAEPCSPG